MPQVERFQIQVHDNVEMTLKRGLEARQVSTTTHLVQSELSFVDYYDCAWRCVGQSRFPVRALSISISI